MKQWSIGPGPAATLLAVGDPNPDDQIPTIIQNVDPNNIVYIGNEPGINPSFPLTCVPLAPGQTIVSDGSLNVFGIAAAGQTVAVNTYRGMASFFLPSIVNGSTISGAKIVDTGGGYWGYNGTPAYGNLFYSNVAGSGGPNDGLGNAYLGGVTYYGNPAGSVWIAVNYGVTNAAYGLVFYTASSPAGPWSIDSWVRRSSTNAGQLEIGPIIEVLSTSLLPATPSGGSKIWVPSGQTGLRVMKLDGNSGYAIGECVIATIATQTISAGWEVVIAGSGVSLVAPVIIGVQYYFEVTIRFTTSATGSATVGFAMPSTSQLAWLWQGDWSLTINGSGSNPGQITIGTTAAAGTYTVKIWGNFTPNANGNFSCGAGTGTAGNFQINLGTVMKLRTTG